MSLLKSKGRTSFFKLFERTGEHQGKRQPKAVRRGHTGRSAHRHAMGSARPRFAVGYVGPLPVGLVWRHHLGHGTHGRNRRSRMQIPGTTQPNTQQRRAARSSPSARGARPPARAWLRENVRGVGDITSLIGPECRDDRWAGGGAQDGAFHRPRPEQTGGCRARLPRPGRRLVAPRGRRCGRLKVRCAFGLSRDPRTRLHNALGVSPRTGLVDLGLSARERGRAPGPAGRRHPAAHIVRNNY